MVEKQKIIEFIRANGPSVPTQIANYFGESSFIIGAMLSELAKAKEIYFSKLKLGASPLYYLYEQRHKLQDYSDHLNEKDKEAYELLKQRGVLYDRDLTPLLRVSLRTITDFAVPVKVSAGDNEELFWRWYLTPLESIKEKISERLYGKKEDEPPAENNHAPEPVAQEKPNEPMPENDEAREEKGQSEDTKQPPTPTQNMAQENEKQEVQSSLDDSEPECNLHMQVKSYCKKTGIKIKNSHQIRKNQEIEYEVIVPSAIGELRYFCRAKSKKKLNENDLANIYLAAKRKDLPALLLTTGDLTKKAENSLESDFPGVKVKNI
ncbi:MAG: hypothetical protein ACQESF_04510 [Nanobdellota archaeon]